MTAQRVVRICTRIIVIRTVQVSGRSQRDLVFPATSTIASRTMTTSANSSSVKKSISRYDASSTVAFAETLNMMILSENIPES